MKLFVAVGAGVVGAVACGGLCCGDGGASDVWWSSCVCASAAASVSSWLSVTGGILRFLAPSSAGVASGRGVRWVGVGG